MKAYNLLISTVLSFTVLSPAIVNAKELTEQQIISSSEETFFLEYTDSNGELQTVELPDGELVTIPDATIQSSDLVASYTITWATYNFYRNGSYLTVVFTPINYGAQMVALGFSGTFQSTVNGILYSINTPVRVFQSSITLHPANNFIILSGQYELLTDSIDVWSSFWVHGSITYNYEEEI